MTGPESEDFVTEDWRGRVDDTGRRHLGREDMIRLGIIRSSEQLSVEAAEPDVAAYDLALDEIAAIRRELKALDAGNQRYSNRFRHHEADPRAARRTGQA